MAQPARLTSGLMARKGQALPTGAFAHAKLDLVPLQPSVAKAEQHRCGTSVPREVLLPELCPAPEPNPRTLVLPLSANIPPPIAPEPEPEFTPPSDPESAAALESVGSAAGTCTVTAVIGAIAGSVYSSTGTAAR